jgi:mannose-6-phosphate isomerase
MSTLVQAQRISASLRDWLLNDALPLWWARGADHEFGGFHERLRQDASPAGEPRRSRLHPRQIHAFSLGAELGWSGHAEAAVQHALRFYLAHYQRSDGLFIRLVAPDGTTRDADAELYDQAFALLGLASAYKLLREESLRQQALQLLNAINQYFRHDAAGFKETPTGDVPLLSNSHMHLLEAALAWLEIDARPCWHVLARDLVALARSRFIDPNSGFILEFFAADWSPLSHGQRVEPGHQFEWAWLLSRWCLLGADVQAHKVALALMKRTEDHGIDRDRRVAVNSLMPNGTVQDAEARLWPQTERLKASLLAAQLENDERYWYTALEAARTLATYLDVPQRGLWRDKLTVAGEFVDEPVPASSLYHIASAINQLDRSVGRVVAARGMTE